MQNIHPTGKNSTPFARMNSEAKPPVFLYHMTDSNDALSHWGWGEVEGTVSLKRTEELM